VGQRSRPPCWRRWRRPARARSSAFPATSRCPSTTRWKPPGAGCPLYTLSHVPRWASRPTPRRHPLRPRSPRSPTARRLQRGERGAPPSRRSPRGGNHRRARHAPSAARACCFTTGQDARFAVRDVPAGDLRPGAADDPPRGGARSRACSQRAALRGCREPELPRDAWRGLRAVWASPRRGGRGVARGLRGGDPRAARASEVAGVMVDVGCAASGTRRGRNSERLAIPVVTTLKGRGLLDNADAPLVGTYLGLAGTPEVSALVEDSDALLMWACSERHQLRRLGAPRGACASIQGWAARALGSTPTRHAARRRGRRAARTAPARAGGARGPVEARAASRGTARPWSRSTWRGR